MQEVITVSWQNYVKLAKQKIENSDVLSGITLLFTALKYIPSEQSYKIYQLLAQAYRQIEEYDSSNGFWYKYLAEAPKNLYSKAYDGLGDNYLASDDLFNSAYYYNLSCNDGKKQDESLSEDVLEKFFYKLKSPKEYYLAYPFNKADFSVLEHNAKNAFSSGDFNLALDIYLKIPPEKLSDYAIENVTLSCYALNKVDVAIDVCRKILKANTNNFSAICNLSSLYNSQDNQDKANYYYELAKSLFNDSVDQSFTIYDCAIEQKDGSLIRRCYKNITKEFPNETAIIFPYAIMLSNCGEYQEAYKQISYLRKLFPSDIEYKFFADYLNKLCATGQDDKGFLPFDYKKELPEKQILEYVKRIEDVYAQSILVGNVVLKKQDLNVFVWSILHGDPLFYKHSIFLLAFSGKPWAYKVLTDLLIDVKTIASAKSQIIYSLIVNGYNKDFFVVANKFFIKLKYVKIPFEDKPNGEIFLAGYASAVSKMVFWNINNTSKLCISANKVYKALKDRVNELKIIQQEVAVLSLSLCKFNKALNINNLCDFFGADIQRVTELFNIIEGAKNDKNS